MNKIAYGLGVIHGYSGVIYDNPYITDYDADAYDEGYEYGEGMLEEELEDVNQ